MMTRKSVAVTHALVAAVIVIGCLCGAATAFVADTEPTFAFAESADKVDAQLDALRWLFANYNGRNWIHTYRGDWETILPKANSTTFGKSACNGTTNTYFIVGVNCVAGRIFGISLRASGMAGPLSGLNYTYFMSKFPGASFDFGSNPGLTGELPKDFSQDATIQDYLVDGCSAEGPIPDELFTRNIVNLNLGQNKNLMAQPFPAGVSRASSLQTLFMGGVNISGEISPGICFCASLQRLGIASSGTTKLPDCMGTHMAPNLISMDLTQNNFKGPIPENWQYLVNLQTLLLTNNGFTGPVPPFFANFRSMTQLSIQNTLMSGPFPNFLFAAMPDMTYLQLQGFSGPVWDRFDAFRWPHLRQLILAGPIQFTTDASQTLSGPFPMSIFSAVKLRSLMIQNTMFTGYIGSKNFTRMPWLCQVNLLQNSALAGEFPTSLFTDIWITNISVQEGQAPRFLTIADSPLFTGPLPDFTDSQVNALLGLDTVNPYVFKFSGCNFWGWIPASWDRWLPEPSRYAVLGQNYELFYPIPTWQWNWTWSYPAGNFVGAGTSLNSVQLLSGKSAASTSGGENATVTGSFPYAPDGSYKIAFFHTNWTDQDIYLISNNSGAEAAWALRVTDVNATLLPLSPGEPVVYQPQYYTTLNFLTPLVDDETEQLMAMVFLDGTFRNPANHNDTALALAVQQGRPLNFYDPTPLVYALSRDQVRLQGCVSLTLSGSGFLNAPLPSLQVQSRRKWHHDADDDINITTSFVQVVSDTLIYFTLPFADAENPDATFSNFTGGKLGVAYPIVFYPAGFGQPKERSPPGNASTMLSFINTCPGRLAPCANGHTDPFDCPIQPMCTCGNRGTCNYDNVSLEYTCGCDEHFEGASCSDCGSMRFGDSCDACDCHHGDCEWGREKDGACDCYRGWMGKKCTTSKLAVGLGVGIPVVAVTGAVAILLVKKFWWAKRGYRSVDRNSADEARSLAGG